MIEQLDGLAIVPRAVILLVDYGRPNSHPLEILIGRVKTAFELAVDEAGRVFQVARLLIDRKMQLAILDRDLRNGLHVAAGEPDEAALEIGCAGAADFKPPGAILGLVEN